MVNVAHQWKDLNVNNVLEDTLTCSCFNRHGLQCEEQLTFLFTCIKDCSDNYSSFHSSAIVIPISLYLILGRPDISSPNIFEKIVSHCTSKTSLTMKFGLGSLTQGSGVIHSHLYRYLFFRNIKNSRYPQHHPDSNLWYDEAISSAREFISCRTVPFHTSHAYFWVLRQWWHQSEYIIGRLVLGTVFGFSSNYRRFFKVTGKTSVSLSQVGENLFRSDPSAICCHVSMTLSVDRSLWWHIHNQRPPQKQSPWDL